MNDRDRLKTLIETADLQLEDIGEAAGCTGANIAHQRDGRSSVSMRVMAVTEKLAGEKISELRNRADRVEDILHADAR